MKFKSFSVFSQPRQDTTCPPVYATSQFTISGHRFNILFSNAAAAFFLHAQMLDYLKLHQTNGLLQSVYHDLQMPEYVAGCKTLGLISRLVTQPLWCLLEDKSVHIFDMNTFYQQLVDFLNAVPTQMEVFMAGQLLPFGDRTTVHRDALFDHLLTPYEHDDKVAAVLMVVMPALAQLCQKLFVDHLSGGKWQNVTDASRLKASGSMKHNIYSESVFGYLDQIFRTKPNISTLAAESFIMFANNKTLSWLQEKEQSVQTTLVRQAIKDGAKLREKFKDRVDIIRQNQRKALDDRRRQVEEQQQRRIEKLENFTNQIIFYGLWQSENQVDAALIEIQACTEKKAALKAQMNFRKQVLKQKLDKDQEGIYRFSKKVNGKTVQCTVEELTEKVKCLVRHSFTVQTSQNHDDVIPLLTGKKVSHSFNEEGSLVWYKGEVISQVRYTSKFKECRPRP